MGRREKVMGGREKVRWIEMESRRLRKEQVRKGVGRAQGRGDRRRRKGEMEREESDRGRSRGAAEGGERQREGGEGA